MGMQKYIFVVLSHSLLFKLTQLWQHPLLRNLEMWNEEKKKVKRSMGLLEKYSWNIFLLAGIELALLLMGQTDSAIGS